MADIIEFGSRSFGRRPGVRRQVEHTGQRAVLRGLLATTLLLVSIGASVAIIDRTFGAFAGTADTTMPID
jgi:hypothetical protein